MAKFKMSGVCFFWAETGTEGRLWAFQDSRFIVGNRWSYDGLHVLKDGDELTIYSKKNPEKVLWSGKISIRKFSFLSKRGAKLTKWAKWFLKGYPAELVPAKKKRQR